MLAYPERHRIAIELQFDEGGRVWIEQGDPGVVERLRQFDLCVPDAIFVHLRQIGRQLLAVDPVIADEIRAGWSDDPHPEIAAAQPLELFHHRIELDVKST